MELAAWEFNGLLVLYPRLDDSSERGLNLKPFLQNCVHQRNDCAAVFAISILRHLAFKPRSAYFHETMKARLKFQKACLLSTGFRTKNGKTKTNQTKRNGADLGVTVISFRLPGGGGGGGPVSTEKEYSQAQEVRQRICFLG